MILPAYPAYYMAMGEADQLADEQAAREANRRLRPQIEWLGMLRVKNEERWLERCLKSMAFCDRIVLLDDHSTDRTAEIAQSFSPRLEYLRSPFLGLDEVRDKNYLLECAECYNPRWVAALDGDEEFTPDAQKELSEWREPELFARGRVATELSFRFLYLWNDEQTVRTDGVYGRFYSARAFQVFAGARFERRGGPAGFHCTWVPRAPGVSRLECSLRDQATILHYGYIDAEIRAKKIAFYRQHDPGNLEEDEYRHITQGDPGGERADRVLLHAGPLRLEPWPEESMSK